MRTLVARVRYDAAPPPDGPRGLLNRRHDFFRAYGEYAMTQPGGESSVQNVNFALSRCDTSSWDPIDDFAFFQDADLRAKLEAEPFWRMTSVEQAYCIPKRGQQEFLRLIDDTVRLYDHFPTLVDLLYAPKDARTTPLPSPSSLPSARSRTRPQAPSRTTGTTRPPRPPLASPRACSFRCPGVAASRTGWS
jgi:hypothetical protein